MKKCVVISCFNYYEIRTKQILKHFQKKGFETTYIIADYDHFAKKHFQAQYPSTIQIPVNAYKKNLSPARLYSHHMFSRGVYRTLKALKPDVIYCIFPPNSLVRDVVKYKRKYGAYLIFDCYDMWPESFPYQKYGKLLSLPFELWRNLREKYISDADKLICVSKAMEDGWNSARPEIKTAVMRPGMTTEEPLEHKPLRNDSLVFCYLGMVNHIIDIDLGIRLLTMLQQHRKVTLHLIGEGENKEAFVCGLQNAGIEVVEHGVTFDSDKKNSIFAQCDLGLNIPRAEVKSSMPLKAIEYMHVGLPFLNNGIEDIRRIVEDTHVGININTDNLNETVSQVLSLGQAKIEKMQKNCMEYYHTEFAQAEILDSVLGECIHSGNYTR